MDWEEGRRDRVRAFLGRPLTDPEAEDWFLRYLGHYESAWALFPDVLPVLDTLAGSHRHAVLSNSSIRVQDHKLRVLGVRDRFESVLCAAELGVSKPAAEAFHAACEALELPPHQVAYVGDHPEIDWQGAADAGLFSVWIDRGGVRAVTAPESRRRAGRAAGSAHRPAPDRLAGRTPCDPPARYPFWSAVHLQVMFFLRRRRAGRKVRNRRRTLKQDPRRGFVFQWPMV